MHKCVREGCNNSTMFGLCNSCKREDVIHSDQMK
jgi:hypothetical protein